MGWGDRIGKEAFEQKKAGTCNRWFLSMGLCSGPSGPYLLMSRRNSLTPFRVLSSPSFIDVLKDLTKALQGLVKALQNLIRAL